MINKANMRFDAAALLLVVFLLGICQIPAISQAKNKKDKDGFVKIFDGKTLNGWEGDTDIWRVENGVLIGEITPGKPLKTNTFIIWKDGELQDFELVGEYRITENGNSGINYRSERLQGIPYALKGYQADIDGKNNYTGQNYEERGRTTLAYRGQITSINPLQKPQESLRNDVKNNAWTGLSVTGSLGDKDDLKSHMKPEGWNEIRLVIKGNRLQHFINGVLMSDVTDNDTANRKMSGNMGIQVHVGPPMKVEFRNLLIKQL